MIDLGIPGVRVGHWTDETARTGCTVLLFPDGTVASGEVRGGAPASREFALLEPSRTVARLDALVLTGGSAFGLAAADGVMAFCEEHGIGLQTQGGKVPIVVALSIFDLLEGDPSKRPGAAEGRAAATDASDRPVSTGRVGAGAGATVGKWRGPDHRRPGGLGAAVVRRGDLVVSALMVVNATGDVDDGSVVRQLAAGEFEDWPDAVGNPFAGDAALGNTTIGVVLTNARLDKTGCFIVSQGGHDGLARALFPPHTRADGDAIVTAAIGQVDAEVDVVRLLAVVAVESAVRSIA